MKDHLIIVIADDITGAAEIAGMSYRHGIPTTIITNSEDINHTRHGVLVIATDTRSHTAEESISITRSICSRIDRTYSMVFRKTDSALRGHIAAELRETAKCLGYRNSILLAQNPSKGRIISNNVYLINNVPIVDTSFHSDPEFPAHSSIATRLVGDEFCRYLPVADNIAPGNFGLNKTAGDQGNQTGFTIYLAEATNETDIKIQLNKASADTMLAGGVDLFGCLINMVYKCSQQLNVENKSIKIDAQNRLLAVCGSTQSKSLSASDVFCDISSNEVSIPDDVFNGGPVSKWFDDVEKLYCQSDALQVRIGEHPIMGKEKAHLLKDIMAKLTHKLIIRAIPKYIVIEGGATAFSILRELGWSTFKVEKEISPGVVMMEHNLTKVILKPGSYPWGNLFCHHR